MKLSQPSSARQINTYRILNLFRKQKEWKVPKSNLETFNLINDEMDDLILSKAEISRILSLNKASTGEIISSLIEDGIVEEYAKIGTTSGGRKATALRLVKMSRFVIAIEIGPRTTNVNLCNLALDVLRFERIKTRVDKRQEDFVVDLIKSCIRALKPIKGNQILGIAVTVQGKISEDRKIIESCPYLPWKDIDLVTALNQTLKIPVVLENSLNALVLAEEIKGNETLAYLDWGERLDLAIVNGSKVISRNSNFGHLKVSKTGLCSCGKIGCLEAVAATWVLAQSPDSSLGEIWSGGVEKKVFERVAYALSVANLVTGCQKIILGGQSSTIPDNYLNMLKTSFKNYLHKYSEPVEIERSKLGDKANILATASVGLDEFFFHKTFLDSLQEFI